jgi:hypothetical protein
VGGGIFSASSLASLTVLSLGAAMSKLRGVKKVRHVAGGFFGEVWQGEWEGVPVAIKVAKGASPKAVEALLREVEVAMSLKLHPNVVAVYGVCDGADGELQLVLEYCEDGALLDWLRRLDKVCDTVWSVAACGWRRVRAAGNGRLHNILAQPVRRALPRGVVCRSRCRRRWMF